MFDYTVLKSKKVEISINSYEKDMSFIAVDSKDVLATLCLEKESAITHIDKFEISEENGRSICRVEGWSADVSYKLPLKCILIIKNNRVISAIKKMIVRSDVALHINGLVSTYGFSAAYPYDTKSQIKFVFIHPSNKYSIYDITSTVNS